MKWSAFTSNSVSSFSFRAFGDSESDALAAMDRTWSAHCEGNPHADYDYYDREEVHLWPVKAGEGYRDYIQISEVK